MTYHQQTESSATSAWALSVLKNVPAMARAHWRSFAFGLSAGCAVALLNWGIGPSSLERQSSRTARLSPAADPISSDPAQGKWASNNPTAVTEVALDEIVIRASPASWQAETTAATRIELETRNVSVSGRAVAAVIMLKRTGSTSGRVRVRCKTIPGTAVPAKDYESLSTIVQFGDEQTMRTLFVPILQQPPESESRTFSVTLERAPRGPSLGTVTSTTVTILGAFSDGTARRDTG